MTSYLAYINANYLPLGYEELYAALEAEKIDYRTTYVANQIVIFTSNESPVKAASRCAFLHSLCILIAKGSIENQEIDFFEEIRIDLPIEKCKTFCVRVKKIGKRTVKLNRAELERILGSYVISEFADYEMKVDLKRPECMFLGLLHKSDILIGFQLWSKNVKEYNERTPGNRPFFKPGAMKADFARAIVNLSRISTGEVFYDPFCGAGGFLIEASILGAYVLGSDLDFSAVKGTDINLHFLGEGHYSLLHGDSRHIPIKHVHAIATDPPYSIQSSTYGKTISGLIEQFLEESKSILEQNRHLVFSSPSYSDPERIAEKVGYKMKTIIDARVHRSLTRRIVVLM